MFEYFREKIAHDGILFLQEIIPFMTLSSTGVTILKVNCFFFHMEPQIHAAS